MSVRSASFAGEIARTGPPSTWPRVAVIVPVKDRRERMLRCLRALLAQDYPDFNILVLDNGSTDGTAEACRELAAGADVPVRVEVVEGSVGHLRNLAAGLVEADVLAYTDSDCLPSASWLREGAPAFCEDEKLGAVQGKTVPEDGKELRPWAATLNVEEFTWRFESCNLLIRREALLDTDGFDETVGHFWEDTAAGWSLARSGWRVAFNPRAVVAHDVTYPKFGWWLQRAQRYGNAPAVVRRYPDLRREHLWAGLFLDRRDAELLAAIAGIALAPLERRALLLAAPYLRRRAPRSLRRAALIGSGQVVAFELSILLGLVRGSIRHRTLVL